MRKSSPENHHFFKKELNPALIFKFFCCSLWSKLIYSRLFEKYHAIKLT